MYDEQIKLNLQAIRQKIVQRKQEDADTWHHLEALLNDLSLLYEQMQLMLEVAQVTEEDLIQQNQYLAEGYHYYYDLFQSSPIPYLITDTHGIIREANASIAGLLNVPQYKLINKPLAVFVPEHHHRAFYSWLGQVSRNPQPQQIRQINLCPRDGSPLLTQWHILVAQEPNGQIKHLRIGIQNLSSVEAEPLEPPKLSQTLNGLQVLVVDDEADVRDFIRVLLESYGVRVRTVASAAEALEELAKFQPDVLLSDIRMPDGDGYSLIRRIRALEAQQGRHLPVVAITAYLEEDREKVLNAGFEAHLHKLAQPSEVLKMVAQLAGRASDLLD